MELTQIRTVYDEIYYIDESKFRPGRLVPLYHADGKPAMQRKPGGSAADWEQIRLHPGNICGHEYSEWKEYVSPIDGSKMKYCPTCSPHYEELDQEGSQPRIDYSQETAQATTGAPTNDETPETDQNPAQVQKAARIAQYEAKRAARIERLKARAANARNESERRLNRARSMASVIPFGQPILVGHHSEKRDRNYRGRIDSNFRKGFEAMDKAEQIESRIESAENNNAIYTDDPQAPEKLESKLDSLLAMQAKYKAINKAHAAYLKNPASLEKADLTEGEKKLIRDYVPTYSWTPHPIAPYQLTNLSARIRDAKKRAARVEKLQAIEDSEKVINGVRIEYAPQENRIRVHFQERVSKEIFQQLKRAGFRHAPSQGKFTFSAYYNNWTKQNAEQIAGKMEVPAN